MTNIQLIQLAVELYCRKDNISQETKDLLNQPVMDIDDNILLTVCKAYNGENRKQMNSIVRVMSCQNDLCSN